MMKILVVAGGTGGHFYPGLSVGKALMAKGHRVVFMVRHHDHVIPLLQRENIPFKLISAAGFNRRFDPRNIMAVIKLMWGTFCSFFIILFGRFDGLLAMGGYLSVPPALVGALFRIPILLHEQNSKPGLANRLLSHLSKQVAISFEHSRQFFPDGKSVLTGNPLRPEFSAMPNQKKVREQLKLKSNVLTLLVFGGSLGARRINELIVRAYQNLGPKDLKFQILHYTGKNDFAWVQKAYPDQHDNVVVEEYCHEMSSAYAAADFILCRAGASTISELMVVQKPALLIPYPFATEDHQTINASVLRDWGVAHVLQQKDLDEQKMTQILSEYIQDPSILSEMQKNYENHPMDPSSAVEKMINILNDMSR